MPLGALKSGLTWPVSQVSSRGREGRRFILNFNCLVQLVEGEQGAIAPNKYNLFDSDTEFSRKDCCLAKSRICVLYICPTGIWNEGVGLSQPSFS